ncbi:MAG: hypothetical protein HY221_02560 [Candidatus Sungbacteria bacterium]|uniref:DUF8128 domain-containing protein n=1 Tax=Candidatus Sungiibacteriota bacterium TaxID=2750080 RepID=A0A932R2G6_9BACT|nr:hypothetical protein [Candidatus Sungbacteria bacterium]
MIADVVDLSLLRAVLGWFFGLWWLWSVPIVLWLALEIWLVYIRDYYRYVTNQWILLEIKIPREIRKSPKAMEQVFLAVHAIQNSASDYQERYWDGEVPLWFSFEVASFGGEIHFFMYIPKVRRNHLEAALYAQYQDVEITEAAHEPGGDYINRLPPTVEGLYNAGYRIFGNELLLSNIWGNKSVYPIRTYVDFEAVAEEKEVDPVATLLETMARIPPQAYLWCQLLIEPKTGDRTDWHKEGQKEVESIKERTGKRRMFSPQFGEFIMIDRAPGDVELMKAIERKIAKPAFNFVLRYMFISPSDVFSSSFGRRSVLSAMNQYASETVSKFGHNVRAWTLAKIWFAPYVFPKRRARGRTERLYGRYRGRQMYKQDRFMERVFDMHFYDWGFVPAGMTRGRNVMNVEELATVYHLPTNLVLTGPLVKRVEAKKGGPPAGLAIYGEEGEGRELPGV